MKVSERIFIVGQNNNSEEYKELLNGRVFVPANAPAKLKQFGITEFGENTAQMPTGWVIHQFQQERYPNLTLYRISDNTRIPKFEVLLDKIGNVYLRIIPLGESISEYHKNNKRIADSFDELELQKKEDDKVLEQIKGHQKSKL